jgi:hypothetical protein
MEAEPGQNGQTTLLRSLDYTIISVGPGVLPGVGEELGVGLERGVRGPRAGPDWSGL